MSLQACEDYFNRLFTFHGLDRGIDADLGEGLLQWLQSPLCLVGDVPSDHLVVAWPSRVRCLARRRAR